MLNNYFGAIIAFSVFFVVHDAQSSELDNFNEVYENYMDNPSDFLLEKIRTLSSGNPQSLELVGDIFASGLGVNVDGNEAIFYYTRSVEAGNVSAHLKIGDLYYKGDIVPRDIDKAMNSFSEAERAGIQWGAIRLADMYINIPIFGKSPENGVDILMALSEQDNASAISALADLYIAGRSVEKDVQKGVLLHKKSAKLGNASSYVKLGDIYYNNKAIDSDYELSLYYYEMAKSLGSEWGEIGVAIGSIDGNFNKYTPEDGMEFLENLSSRGNPHAMAILAGQLIKNKDSTLDQSRALELLRKSGEKNNSAAYLTLANIYKDGDIESRDLNLVQTYLNKAAELGNVWGEIQLASEYIAETFGEDRVRDGIQILEELAVKNNSEALLRLGSIYTTPQHASFSPNLGLEYLEKSAALGNAGAYIKIGDLYRQDLFVDNDNKKSKEYYLKASDAGNIWGNIKLAEGYISGQYVDKNNGKNNGLIVLQQLADKGFKEAKLSLANSYIRGDFGKKKASQGMALLQELSDAGDVNAIKTLLSLYRDGKKDMFRKDNDAAKTLLSSSAIHLRKMDYISEKILLEASNSSDLHTYEEISNTLSAMPVDWQERILPRVLISNENFYVYYLQQAMRNNGFYDGKLNGYLTTKTINSFNKMVKTLNKKVDTNKGPLNYFVVKSISKYIFQKDVKSPSE